MLKGKLKSFITVVSILALCTCVDPYSPDLKGYDSILVVEGLITDENTTYVIKLSRTMQAQNSIREKISDATVFITDETGNKMIFSNSGDGSYKSDSTVFTGLIGKTYTLHITSHEGAEYQSEPCLMMPVPDIDSIYFEKEEVPGNDLSPALEGIRIFLDSEAGDGINNYFRWDYTETWKFSLPLIKRFNYLDEHEIILIPHPKEYCWKQQRSSEIFVRYYPPQQAGNIKKIPLNFIASDKSDRLRIQYSILIRQYSISEKESRFWDNLKKVNESGGDIFGSMPFPVVSNIINIGNPAEPVLGYFQVSAVSQKRTDITFSELQKLDLPLFNYDCKRIETRPEDYACNFCTLPTFNELNEMWVNAGFEFVEPIVDPETKELRKLVFSDPVCSDCEQTGTLIRPDFWIDRNN